MEAVKFGLVGLGGWAGACCDAILRCQQLPDCPVRLVAAAEPDQTTHADRVDNLRDRGIAVVSSIDEILELDIEALWLPLPIHLHRPFTEKALAAGKAVLCEKPAAGCIDDVDAMIAARDKAKLAVAIAFQDMYVPSTQLLKQMLVNGDIGQIEQLTVWAVWPRTDQYFARSNWAGKLKAGDTWVLDSPANNAMAHYANLALFFMGQSIDSSADLASVEVELYRANPVENYDTICLRAKTDTGATLMLYMTHADQTLVGPNMIIKGSAGRAEWERQHITITPQDQQTTRLRRIDDSHQSMLTRFAQEVRGGDDATGLMATLETARAHAKLISAASQATPVHTIDESHLQRVDTEHGQQVIIEGIGPLIDACLARGEMWHESGRVPWTKPAGRLDLTGYNHFTGPPAP